MKIPILKKRHSKCALLMLIFSQRVINNCTLGNNSDVNDALDDNSDVNDALDDNSNVNNMLSHNSLLMMLI